jgi:hypothetical protein
LFIMTSVNVRTPSPLRSTRANQAGVVRPEFLWRPLLVAVCIEPAEPGSRIPRELGLADVAVAVGVGGAERHALGDIGGNDGTDLG